MKESDLNTTTWYNPDYRSWPSAIGYINKPDGSQILISDSECGPKNMTEAAKYIKAEYLPNAVENIPGEFWDHRETFGNILKNHGVTHILDLEHYTDPVSINTYLKDLL
jgi:hypothetical protein